MATKSKKPTRTLSRSTAPVVKGALPSADELKDRFAPQSVPISTDFGNLIDIAEIGRRAVGLSPGQDTTGNGLELDGIGDAGTLKVKAGAGITVDADGVSVTPTAIAVTGGPGITVGTDRKVSVAALGNASGLIFDGTGDAGTLKVKAGAGITVDENGVSVDMHKILPIGSIIMFSGSSIPDGWHPCDGENDTPNFRFSLLMGAIDPEQTGNPTMIPTGEIEAGLQAVFVCLIIKVR
ncbi:tail fiber protein [Collimonas humicola]|uniref:tail fiber protein n=1 Tax=Collimonas humicola TaxID=2825886 RepID=UPI001B8D8AE5|nr:tail fiber protein [Collimonas humicola]